VPLYYLHISDGAGFVEDEEGQQLADDAAARAQAIAAARDIMAAELREGALDLGTFIEVENEKREWLFTITFAEAVTIREPAKETE
jgi:hypothetical protein